jgi:hypothetical protein
MRYKLTLHGYPAYVVDHFVKLRIYGDTRASVVKGILSDSLGTMDEIPSILEKMVHDRSLAPDEEKTIERIICNYVLNKITHLERHNLTLDNAQEEGYLKQKERTLTSGKATMVRFAIP